MFRAICFGLCITIILIGTSFLNRKYDVCSCEDIVYEGVWDGMP